VTHIEDIGSKPLFVSVVSNNLSRSYLVEDEQIKAECNQQPDWKWRWPLARGRFLGAIYIVSISMGFYLNRLHLVEVHA
jgi:hypothetical protein